MNYHIQICNGDLLQHNETSNNTCITHSKAFTIIDLLSFWWNLSEHLSGSQLASHSSPSRVRYGVSFVSWKWSMWILKVWSMWILKVWSMWILKVWSMWTLKVWSISILVNTDSVLTTLNHTNQRNSLIWSDGILSKPEIHELTWKRQNIKTLANIAKCIGH